MEINLDMTLTLDKDGTAEVSYVEWRCGADYSHKFHFPEDLKDGGNGHALDIGQDILSWFAIMQDKMKNEED